MLLFPLKIPSSFEYSASSSLEVMQLLPDLQLFALCFYHTITLGVMRQQSSERVSLQRNRGVTAGGRQLLLNRDGLYRVTHTCARSTCPVLYPLTCQNTPWPFYTTCGSLQTRVESRAQTEFIAY